MCVAAGREAVHFEIGHAFYAELKRKEKRNKY